MGWENYCVETLDKAVTHVPREAELDSTRSHHTSHNLKPQCEMDSLGNCPFHISRLWLAA